MEKHAENRKNVLRAKCENGKMRQRKIQAQTPQISYSGGEKSPARRAAHSLLLHVTAHMI
jgi:hypothetical protein